MFTFRTRKVHKDVKIIIEEKRSQVLEEKLRFYEEVIRQEKAAVEAEIEKRRIDEEEKKKAEARAEEIRLRHLEKEKLRKVEEERKIVELQKLEKAKKAEEEERANLMSDQKLHWLKNDCSEDHKTAVDRNTNCSKSDNLNLIKPDITEKSVIESQDVGQSELTHLYQNHLPDQKPEVIADFSKLNGNMESINMNNSGSKPDNHNLNHYTEVDNKQHDIISDNDNSKKSKPSFFENITSKAKNLFKQSSTSNEFTLIDNSHDTGTETPLQLKNTKNNDSLSITEYKNKVKAVNAVTVSNEHIFKLAVSVSSQNIPVFGDCVPMKSDNYPSKPLPQSVTKCSLGLSGVLPGDSGNCHDQQGSINPVVTPLKMSSAENPVTHLKSRIVNDNPLLLSLDSALSSKPQELKMTSSLDLTKASLSGSNNPQVEAKAEYRRKRKLRKDITLAREISDVSKRSLPPSPSPNIMEAVNWEEYVTELLACFGRWKDIGNTWTERVKPPPTATSGRFVARNFNFIQPRTVNNDTTVIENQHCTALQNVDSCEVYVADSSSLDVGIDHSCSKLELLSLQRCLDTNVGIIESSIKCLYQNDCGVSKLEKVPASLLLMDVNRNEINRLNPVSCSHLVVVSQFFQIHII